MIRASARFRGMAKSNRSEFVYTLRFLRHLVLSLLVTMKGRRAHARLPFEERKDALPATEKNSYLA